MQVTERSCDCGDTCHKLVSMSNIVDCIVLAILYIIVLQLLVRRWIGRVYLLLHVIPGVV